MCGREDLVPLIHQLQQERAAAVQQHAEAASWQRYLSCTSLPDPRLRPDMNDFFNCLLESSTNQLEPTLKECEVSFYPRSHVSNECQPESSHASAQEPA
jgi:hypothetical protein